MDQFLLDYYEPDLQIMELAAGVLRRGGVVAYPTETVYGLGVDPRSDRAVQRLLGVKERPAGSPIALIAADTEQAERAGRFGPLEKRLAADFWPGPLTIVVPAAPGVSRALLGGGATVGIRVSGHPVARALAHACGDCITATSANLSGHPAVTTAGEVAAILGSLIDVLLDSGPAPGGPPSTVVQIVDGAPRLHRVGAVAWDRVLRSVQ